MEATPPTASFRSSESHSIGLKKKRKLHDESGCLSSPSPKQRFRVGTNISGQGLVFRGGFFSEEPIVKEIQNEFEHSEESEKDSNTFNGAYDNSMSSDAKYSNENSISSAIHQIQPSNSLNSCGNGVLKYHLYSLESRGMKEVDNGESEDLEEMNSGLGLDLDASELSSEADAATESMNLYSNDLPPHSLLLSSGRWNLGEGTSRLTIDQEFEQYFSSLLL